MKKKVCIVTGASSGIGLETARALAEQNFCVVMACRNVEKAEIIKEEFIQMTQNYDVCVIKLDLSSFKSIDNFIKIFTGKFNKLDVLINNAGTFCDRAHKNIEGFELTMGVNFIGTYYLTQNLLSQILQTTKARIINVSSIVGLTHNMKGRSWDFYNIKCGFKSYNSSKLAQILYTIDLAEQLRNKDVTVNALHPGVVGTNIWTGEGIFMKLTKPIMKLIFASPEKGAKTSVYLATSPDVEGVSGMMFSNNKVVDYKKSSLDNYLRQELMTKIKRTIREVTECTENLAI